MDTILFGDDEQVLHQVGAAHPLPVTISNSVVVGGISVADGADVTQGARGDAVYAGGAGSTIALLKGIFAKLSASLNAAATPVAPALVAYTMHFANTTTTSAEVGGQGGLNLGGNGLVAIMAPAGFNGTSLAVQVSFDDSVGSYLPLYDSAGAAVAVTIAAGHATAITAATTFAAFNYVKFVSNVAMTADRVLTLIGRPL